MAFEYIKTMDFGIKLVHCWCHIITDVAQYSRYCFRPL